MAIDEAEGGIGGSFRDGQQAERLHEDEGRAVSAGLAGTHEELTSSKAHRIHL
jgi:hypothetical protein